MDNHTILTSTNTAKELWKYYTGKYLTTDRDCSKTWLLNQYKKEIENVFYDKYLWPTSLYGEWKPINKSKEDDDMFNLGDVKLVKNDFDILESGEAIILCPGYGKDDFIVQENEDGVLVVVKTKEGRWDEFNFGYDPDYKPSKTTYGVKDGVFRLKAEYNLKSNVPFDDNL